MRVGILILPEYRWSQAAPRWRAAEAYGFDHAWTYDHLGWRTLVDGPWFGAVPTLTAAATVTDRIRLGTLVASPNFRHPVPFARELLALDDICGGRFTLGIGSGAAGAYDTVAMGAQEIPTGVRLARFAEFVELTDALLTRERTTFRGEFYTAVEARGAPGCVQRPRLPFVVAATGPRAMRVAARFGQGWVAVGRRSDDLDGWWRAVAEQSATFDEALAAAERDRSEVDRYLAVGASPVYALSSVEQFRDALGRAERLGFTDLVTNWPRPDGVYAGRESVLEAVAAEVLPAARG